MEDAKITGITPAVLTSRMGTVNVKAVQWDATEFDPASENKADLVIADLPCSGLGIIGRKPDIKYHTTE